MTKKSQKDEKNPVGRPTDYDSDFHPADLLALAKHGKSVTQCCALWSIGRNTFYEWCKAHADFKDAFTRARPLIDAYWMDKAEDGLIESGNDAGYRKTNHNVLKMLFNAHALSSSDDRAIIIPGFAESATPDAKRDCVINALARGDITSNEADKFLTVLQKALAISEASEFGQRLKALEEAHGVSNGIS